MTEAEKDSPIPDIPKSHQFGPVRKSVIKKNKVKKVEVEVLDCRKTFGKVTEIAQIAPCEIKDGNIKVILLDKTRNNVDEYKLEIVKSNTSNSAFIQATVDLDFNQTVFLKTVKYNVDYSYNDKTRGNSTSQTTPTINENGEFNGFSEGKLTKHGVEIKIFGLSTAYSGDLSMNSDYSACTGVNVYATGERLIINKDVIAYPSTGNKQSN